MSRRMPTMQGVCPFNLLPEYRQYRSGSLVYRISSISILILRETVELPEKQMVGLRGHPSTSIRIDIHSHPVCRFNNASCIGPVS
jgi:hypothetical protein